MRPGTSVSYDSQTMLVLLRNGYDTCSDLLYVFMVTLHIIGIENRLCSLSFMLTPCGFYVLVAGTVSNNRGKAQV
jgi:hypothetical protein